LVKSSWGLAHPMSLTELALLDGRRPLPLWDVIGLTLTLTGYEAHIFTIHNHSFPAYRKTVVRLTS
jgi:hypothetical protein